MHSARRRCCRYTIRIVRRRSLITARSPPGMHSSASFIRPSPIRKPSAAPGSASSPRRSRRRRSAAQLRALLKDFPGAKWHQYEPAGAHTARAGAKLAFGEPVNTYYRVENAKVVLSLDSDFLTSGPGHVRYARARATVRTYASTQPRAAHAHRRKGRTSLSDARRRSSGIRRRRRQPAQRRRRKSFRSHGRRSQEQRRRMYRDPGSTSPRPFTRSPTP